MTGGRAAAIVRTRFGMRSFAASISALVLGCASFCTAASADATRLYAVGYASSHALSTAVAGRGEVVGRITRLHVAELRADGRELAAALRRMPGIRFVQPVSPRASTAEPGLLVPPGLAAPYEWQYPAVREDLVPEAVLRAAASVTIAIVDTGADLTAPDLAAKHPHTFDLHTASADVRDTNGHGTFVASLAAGSVTNGDGIAGFGGDAKLLVLKASRADGTLSDVDEVNAIVYAVDHGANIVNLSVGGDETSLTERRGIQYAADHGVLVVAAAGNEYEEGNPVEYPAALLQPVGSNGQGGIGLSVGASNASGTRAFFSNAGSQISLVAPGENVFGAVSSLAPAAEYPRADLPGATAGSYGFASGTSFSAPEVAGVAALVMAANPLMPAGEVAAILKQTASGGGAWNPATGFGVVDAAAAVARAQGYQELRIVGIRTRGKVRLRWFSPAAARYRVSVRVDRQPTRVLLASTTETAATFALRSGHRYVFTVAGFDADGTETASSTYSVRA